MALFEETYIHVRPRLDKEPGYEVRLMVRAKNPSAGWLGIALASEPGMTIDAARKRAGFYAHGNGFPVVEKLW